MINAECLIAMAERTGVFGEPDLAVLSELLVDYRQNGEKNYRLLGECVDNRCVGFVLFGRTPLTQCAWDIYWVVVDKAFQGRGIGSRLLCSAERNIADAGCDGIPVLRLETSSRSEYAPARRLYEKNGYTHSGTLPHFYRRDDHLMIFSKQLSAAVGSDSGMKPDAG